MNFSGPEILLVLVIVLIIFGAGKLPQVFSSLGKGVREFRDAAEGDPHAPTAPTTSTGAATTPTTAAPATPVTPVAPVAPVAPAAPTAASTTTTDEVRRQG